MTIVSTRHVHRLAKNTSHVWHGVHIVCGAASRGVVTGYILVLLNELIQRRLDVSVFVLRQMMHTAHPAPMDNCGGIRGLASPRLTPAGKNGCITHKEILAE